MSFHSIPILKSKRTFFNIFVDKVYFHGFPADAPRRDVQVHVVHKSPGRWQQRALGTWSSRLLIQPICRQPKYPHFKATAGIQPQIRSEISLLVDDTVSYAAVSHHLLMMLLNHLLEYMGC